MKRCQPRVSEIPETIIYSRILLYSRNVDKFPYLLHGWLKISGDCHIWCEDNVGDPANCNWGLYEKISYSNQFQYCCQLGIKWEYFTSFEVLKIMPLELQPKKKKRRFFHWILSIVLFCFLFLVGTNVFLSCWKKLRSSVSGREDKGIFFFFNILKMSENKHSIMYQLKFYARSWGS